jgi:DNA primase
MTLDAMNFNLEVIAPDSENSSLKPHLLNNLKSKYKKIITVFDNDEAGIAAMDKYRTEHGINGCFYPYAKDISDGVRENGLSSVRNVMERIMLETINK